MRAADNAPCAGRTSPGGRRTPPDVAGPGGLLLIGEG